MAFIEIRGLKKSFGDLEVLHNVNFDVHVGDVIAVIGSSGSGKSTLLRCIIGLEQVNGGTVTVDGRNMVTDGVYASNSEVHEICSKMGMVFQSFNLFPHLSVEDNLTMPYKLTKGASAEDAKRLAYETLLQVGMADKMKSKPGELSGGQQQRVAIARAMMLKPEIMLFDEPTSALDPQLTGEVLGVMKQLAAEKMTMIVVTHEMSFARDVASKVVYMADGEIIEEGTPDKIFGAPEKQRTKDFLKSYKG